MFAFRRKDAWMAMPPMDEIYFAACLAVYGPAFSGNNAENHYFEKPLRGAVSYCKGMPLNGGIKRKRRIMIRYAFSLMLEDDAVSRIIRDSSSKACFLRCA